MTSPFNGGCPAPFLEEDLFPKTGGFLPGRSCAPNPLEGANATFNCCLPCPVYDSLYADDFKQLTDGAAWVHVVGFILCGFLLISMAVLPIRATRRSFLNIILLVGIMLLELGFIIPLAGQPEQCHNAITPNDMYSSNTCAVSGAFVAFGGMTLVTWILVRALFMHLQIVWDTTPRTTHFISANLAAWTVTIALTTAVLAHAGVSFRFGAYCHVNHTSSIPTYWAWLLAFGGLALVLQLATFAYCVKVYLHAALLRSDVLSSGSQAENKVGGPQGSVVTNRSQRARAAAKRVRLVLLLQWRSLAIVALAIFNTAFVCVVFIVLDSRAERLAFAEIENLVPWITCMVLTRDNEACLGYTGPIIIPERVTVATLFILAFVGIEAFFLLCRVDVFRAWGELGRKLVKGRKRREVDLGPLPEEERAERVVERRESSVELRESSAERERRVSSLGERAGSTDWEKREAEERAAGEPAPALPPHAL